MRGAGPGDLVNRAPATTPDARSMRVASHGDLDLLETARESGDPGPVLDPARAAGVGHPRCVAVDRQPYPAMHAQVAGHAEVAVSVSVGVHPNHRYAGGDPLAPLLGLAADPRVVAIGGTGPDDLGSEGTWTGRAARSAPPSRWPGPAASR